MDGIIPSLSLWNDNTILRWFHVIIADAFREQKYSCPPFPRLVPGATFIRRHFSSPSFRHEELELEKLSMSANSINRFIIIRILSLGIRKMYGASEMRVVLNLVQVNKNILSEKVGGI